MNTVTSPAKPHRSASTEKLAGREWRNYVGAMAAVSARLREGSPARQEPALPSRNGAASEPNSRQLDFSNAVQAALKRTTLDRRSSNLSAFRVSGLQKWEGLVIDTWQDMFTAELISHDGGPTVLADFNIAALGGEREINPGDVVYVTVREVVGNIGLTFKTSAVRLQRLGRWTAAEVAEQRQRAAHAYTEVAEFIEED